MRRRQALTAVGGLLTATAAGCVTPGQIFDTYRHVKDAPVDGPEVGPWPTLAYDSRRSGHAPYGWLPENPAVSQFTTAGRRSGVRPVLVDGTVYFSSGRIDDAEGVRGARQAGLRAVGSDLRNWFVAEPGRIATPTVTGNALLVATDGATRALDRRDGTLCWEYRAGNGAPAASPTVLGETVYTTGDRVVALSARTGAVEWASDRVRGRVRGTAATDGGVFATASGGGEGMVYRFDPETGRRLWATSAAGGLLVGPVVGDLVHVLEADGRLSALDPSDGSESWSRELDGSGTTLPALAGGTVYALSTGGNTLAAFDASTGVKRWQFQYGGQFTASPTVAGDTVYLPMAIGKRGQLVALDAPSSRIDHVIQLPEPPVSPLVATAGTGLIAASLRGETRLLSLTYPEL